MNNSPVSIAVLLTCHNRREKTLHCLNRLFSQEGIGSDFVLEVFLVDDGSTDGTGDAVRKEYPGVEVIQGDGNLFWARGMRLAWETAASRRSYDFYCWINDDTFIKPAALKLLLDCYHKAGSHAIITGATCTEATGQYSYGGETREGVPVVPNGSLQPCALMNGNFVIIDNTVFNAVGFIDKTFYHAIGDRDYSLRAIKKGFSVFVTPEYIGTCELHDRLPAWCSPDVPFFKRLKILYSPRGYHPYQFFIYEKRHYSVLPAIKHYFTIHLRAMFPSLWNKKN